MSFIILWSCGKIHWIISKLCPGPDNVISGNNAKSKQGREGMKLAQKNRETSRLTHGKLGRRVPWSGRRDNPSLLNLLGERRQTLNLLNDFNILFGFIVIIISLVTILEAFHYFLHIEQIFIFCSFFGKWFEVHFSRNAVLILAVAPLLH